MTAEMSQMNSFISFFNNVIGKDWSYDVYYVGEDDSNDVTITEDGNLKYQVEFRNSAEIPANAVEIRIPQVLFMDRYGSPVLPSEIAVPEGTPDDPTESRVSMFNYYVEETDLVFFNYGELDAGTSSAFQVLYRNLDMMQIEDGTTWSLQSNCTVAGGEGEEPSTGEADALTGTVNTSVMLSGVTMTPYVIDGKSYSPGLYTEDQIGRIIEGSLPAEYQGDQFNNYRYVVWDVKVYGNATQPWEMYVKSAPSFGTDGSGTVVGFSVPAEEAGEQYDGYYKVEIPDVRMDRLNDSFQIVTAYPAQDTPAGTEVRNQVTVSLHPVDGLDKDSEMSGQDSWTWADYKWTYEGNKIGMGKRVLGEDTYASWLNVYKAASEAGEDKGSFRFNISSFVRGYEDTHITANGETMGDLIEGKSYESVTVDDTDFILVHYQGLHREYGIGKVPDVEVSVANSVLESVKFEKTDAGIRFFIPESGLVYGGYKSCGCLQREKRKQIPEKLHLVDGTCIEMLEKRKHRSDNKSGFRGVNLTKNGKYRVSIGFQRKRYYIGMFASYEEAVAARVEAEQQLHGEFLKAYRLWEEKAGGDPKWKESHPFSCRVERSGKKLSLLIPVQQEDCCKCEG